MDVVGFDALHGKTSAVSMDGTDAQAPIEGVRVRPVRPVPHDDGTLAEVARASWEEIDEPIVQVHVTSTLAGRTRAWSLHKRSVDRLFVVSGLVSLVVFDGRTDSPTFGAVNKFTLSDRNPALVVIPPLLYHGYKNIGASETFLLNMPTEQYEYDEPDAFHLSYDSSEAAALIPFRW